MSAFLPILKRLKFFFCSLTVNNLKELILEVRYSGQGSGDDTILGFISNIVKLKKLNKLEFTFRKIEKMDPQIFMLLFDMITELPSLEHLTLLLPFATINQRTLNSVDKMGF